LWAEERNAWIAKQIDRIGAAILQGYDIAEEKRIRVGFNAAKHHKGQEYENGCR